ncbi:hypothetical protein [Pseudodesulfovibrio sp.]|uniref:hypothetical protein n=1 Tax=unclassified Pseudodesulfovibrio TaxID=2661612 RepID=UPI003B00F48A
MGKEMEVEVEQEQSIYADGGKPHQTQSKSMVCNLASRTSSPKPKGLSRRENLLRQVLQ